MKLQILLIMSILTVLFASPIPHINSKELNSQIAYDWVKLTGKVTNKTKKRIELTDEYGSMLIFFENQKTKSIKQILQKIAIGDTLSVMGEARPMPKKINRIRALSIYRNEQPVFNQSSSIPLNLTPMENDFENINLFTKFWVQEQHNKKQLGAAFITLGGACFIGGIREAFNIETFPAGLLMIIGSPGLIGAGISIISETNDYKRKLKGIPVEKESAFTLGLSFNSSGSSRGIFLNGTF